MLLVFSFGIYIVAIDCRTDGNHTQNASDCGAVSLAGYIVSKPKGSAKERNLPDPFFAGHPECAGLQNSTRNGKQAEYVLIQGKSCDQEQQI